MNLLIDVGSIKTGGGAQLAINFLDWLESHAAQLPYAGIALLLPENGPLAKFETHSNLINEKITYPNSYLKRKLFELTVLPSFLERNNITHIFTFFGAGLPKFNGIKSLVSVAYPIICYPDSPFWKTFPLKHKLRQQLLNVFRCMRIRSADMVLVETEVMRQRLEKNVGVEKEKLAVFPPVPSAYVADSPFIKRQTDNPNFLFLSGLDHHKNLWQLPAIAKALRELGLARFTFSLSVNKQNYLDRFLREIELCGMDVINQHFIFLGTIPSREINNVYSAADYLVNISDLESFSNNYMEAWKAGVPLICSDTDFARWICKESAIYISPNDAVAAASHILGYVNAPDKQETNVLTGKKLLSAMPSLQDRVIYITNLLSKI